MKQNLFWAVDSCWSPRPEEPTAAPIVVLESRCA